MNLKRMLPVICAFGMFLACSMTAFAGDLPVLEAKEQHVKVSHDNTSETVKINIKNGKSGAYVVKTKVMDPEVARVEVSSQSTDSFKIKIKAKGTGTTAVKVWLDGYSRACEYIVVDSINYQKDKTKGYKVKHYGIMTGTKGEGAIIEDYEIKNVDGEDRLYVYFTFKDKGSGDGVNATFTMKAEEDDGDSLGNVNVTATGMVEGGKGYKMYFKIPSKAVELKLVNNDV